MTKKELPPLLRIKRKNEMYVIEQLETIKKKLHLKITHGEYKKFSINSRSKLTF